jgi:asparagine synthase (glutamine-hydrolysing)
MCGIIGSIANHTDQTILIKLLQELSHRGPDDQGEQLLSVAGKSVWLGQTRLAILDLSEAGHQPMQSRDGRWWVSYNGEIYNHIELRKTLKGAFRGHSDTETLVELLVQDGIKSTITKLNGMFAFAALDTIEAKLYLVRDPFGIKPLYYTEHNGSLMFASEVRALRKAGLTSFEVDLAGLDTFLSLRFVPSPQTLWQGVQRLPPGHLFTFDLSSARSELQRYILPIRDRFKGSLQDAVHAYRDILGAAVQRQMLSDVPLGVLLSGGIDSALIAALASKSSQTLSTFTVGFGKGNTECEISDAAETARVLGLSHAAVEVSPEDLRKVIPAVVAAVEEPLGTTSILPMWYLVQRARQDVTVVLTGQGNDEPWGGYRRYQVELIRRLFPFPSLFRGLQPLRYLWQAMPEVLERGLRCFPVSAEAERFAEAYALFNSDERILLTGRSGDGTAVASIRNWLGWLENKNIESAERMMRIDSRMNLADDLLLYGDKISMSTSLEARVPMLDLDVVRFVESLPISYRVGIRRTKIVHKLMAQNYLPTEIVHRPKKGFQVPFGQWSRGPWRDWIESVLLDSNAPHWAQLQRVGVEKLWKQHLVAKPDRSRQIFALLMLTVWWQQIT